MWVKWKVGTFSEGGEKFKYFSLYKIREGDTGSYSYFKDSLGFFTEQILTETQCAPALGDT